MRTNLRANELDVFRQEGAPTQGVLLQGLETQVRDRMGDDDWMLLTALLVRFLNAFDHPLPSLTQSENVADT